jgi:hypothetical protein
MSKTTFALAALALAAPALAFAQETEETPAAETTPAETTPAETTAAETTAAKMCPTVSDAAQTTYTTCVEAGFAMAMPTEAEQAKLIEDNAADVLECTTVALAVAEACVADPAYDGSDVDLSSCEKVAERIMDVEKEYANKAIDAILACEAPEVTDETCADAADDQFCISLMTTVLGVDIAWPKGCSTDALACVVEAAPATTEETTTEETFCEALNSDDDEMMYPTTYPAVMTMCGDEAVTEVVVSAAPFAAVSAAAVAALAALALVF